MPPVRRRRVAAGALSTWHRIGMPRDRRGAVAALIALAGACIVAPCILQAGAAEPEAKAPPPALIRRGDQLFVPPDSPLRARISVAPATADPTPHSEFLPGVVEADPAATVNILPPLTGRLLELRVHLGDTVRRGQVLAVLASGDLAQAYADADKARDALGLAQKALERSRTVNDAGANAVKDIEQAESGAAQARAELARAESRLATLGAPPASSHAAQTLAITAPIGGAVTALNAGAGAYLNDPTAALLTIANLDRVWITANVTDGLLPAIHRGDPVTATLQAYPDQPLHGKVGFIGAIVEPDTRRTRVRSVFPNPDGRLKPNMFATVEILVPQPPQVLVPTSALLMNNDAVTVFVEVASWTFARRAVELGVEDGNRVRVAGGLAEGVRIVVRGGVLLND